MTIRLHTTAADKKAGLTLADVRDLLAEAERAGLTEGRIKGLTGFRGQLHRLEIVEEPA